PHVMPKGQRLMSKPEQNASHRQNDNSTGKHPGGGTGFAQSELFAAHHVEPTQPGQKTEPASQRDPRLRAQGCWEQNTEVVRESGAPGRFVKPGGGQKTDGRPKQEREQDEIDRQTK